MAKATRIPVEQLSEQTAALFDVLNEEQDLAVITIAVGFLDACLKSVLEQKLIDSQVTDRLLNHTGALGGMRARADLCYALGLIPKSWYENLCRFGEIRNDVAHHHLSQSFESDNIARTVASLTTPLEVAMGPLEGRNRFTIVSSILANQLLLEALSLKAKKTVAAKEPSHARFVLDPKNTAT